MGKCLPPKTRLGRYQIVEYIGEGSTASVYRALAVEDAQGEVALKVLKPRLTEDRTFMHRLARELKLCKELVHPNVAGLLAVRQQDGLVFLVLEYLPGEDLDARLRHGALPVELGVRVLSLVMEALSFAHRHGIVHRDIKPANIRLTPKGLKVMDFGMARTMGSTEITQTGALLGTPRYISPEQIVGSPEEIDGRSDQYSLGVTAFEMFTGSAPFSDTRVPQLLTAHMSQAPPSMKSLRGDIPEALEHLVQRMMSKSPSDRYPSLDLALADLSAI